MLFKSFFSNSKGNLNLLRIGGDNYIIDAGISIGRIRETLGLHTIKGCLITHSHSDHSKAVKDLIARGKPCYMLKETAQELDIKQSFLLKEIEYYKAFNINPFSLILPVEACHDVPCTNFVIFDIQTNDSLYFITDTSKIDIQRSAFTHLAIEINYSEKTISANVNKEVLKRTIKTHLSLENALTFLKQLDKSKLREVHLLHLSAENSDSNYFVEEVRKVVNPMTKIFV